jgi:hypothetical protein
VRASLRRSAHPCVALPDSGSTVAMGSPGMAKRGRRRPSREASRLYPGCIDCHPHGFVWIAQATFGARPRGAAESSIRRGPCCQMRRPRVPRASDANRHLPGAWRVPVGGLCELALAGWTPCEGQPTGWLSAALLGGSVRRRVIRGIELRAIMAGMAGHRLRRRPGSCCEARGRLHPKTRRGTTFL